MTFSIPLAIPFPDIDPALFTLALGGYEFSLRWYALAYIAGLVLGWRLMVRLMRRPGLWPGDKAPMTPAQPEELLTWMILGVVLGGRLGYVIFYNPAYFLDHPAEIVQVWQGGMSFHGGFIGVIVSLLLFARSRGMALLQAGDAVALAAPAGLLFGRLANFINGELWGRVTDAPWAMVFPGAGAAPRHPSQLYEAGLEGLALGAVMWFLALRCGWLKRPGAVIGIFFIGYGLARSLVENFRQWDAHLGYVVEIGSGGLTMGQMLSLPMVLIGLGFIWNAWRRGPENGAV
jgi:phosphatidylglycerol:prolipoprotein diacylglycerol transferase